MEKDHSYKLNTQIKLTLNIGLAGGQEDIFSLGDLINIDDQVELDQMSKDAVEGSIILAMEEWTFGYIDRGWDIVR
jgi:hypothetical protein